MILANAATIWAIPLVAPSEARLGAAALINNAKHAVESSQSSTVHEVLGLHTIAHHQASRQHMLSGDTQPHRHTHSMDSR